MKTITPRFRVSYPNVFKAKYNKLSKKDEYSIVALFPKGADLSALKKVAQQVLEEEFGPDQNKWPKNLRSPFRDQADRKKTDDNGKEIMPAGYEEGAIYLNLRSTIQPGVVNENVQKIIEEKDFYAGCWAIASVNCFYYDQGGNKGLSFSLGNIQKVADGDPLGGRSRPEEDFVAVAGESSGSSSGSTSIFG